MKNLMDKLSVAVVIAAMCFVANAEVAEVGGNTWYYSVDGGVATITNVTVSSGTVGVPASVGDDIPVVAIAPGVCQYDGTVVSLAIPDSVMTIGDDAFEYCRRMSSLTIGTGLASVGRRVFCNCDNLTTITVDAANQAFVADGNVLYNKAKTVLVLAPSSLSSTFTTPESVTEIAESAFSGSRIPDIMLPPGLKAIGDSAFYNCDRLSTVTLPQSLETIGADAFSSCDGLSNVTLGGVKDIGDNAFMNCPSLKAVVIPNSTTNIGGGAFASCSELSSVHIGSGVRKIGTGIPRDEFGNVLIDGESPLPMLVSPAFAPCHKLLNFTLEAGNETFDCYDGCLFYKNTPNNAKTLAVYPSGRADLYFSGVTVAEIGEGACAMCDNFGEITVPDTVRNIAEEAFIACNQIYKLTVPEGITNIAYGAFALSLELMDVEIAGTVKSIGDSAFIHDYMPDDRWENPVAGRLVLHDGIESIGKTAFSNAPMLGDIIIPDSVTTLGEGAFSNWERMTKRIVIGSGLSEISASAFEGSDKLAELVIGENVSVIGDSAFSGCTSIRVLNIPEGVTWIGDYAFYGCTSLCVLNLPGTVMHIGEYAFGGSSFSYSMASAGPMRSMLGATPSSSSYAYGGCEDVRRVLIPHGVAYIGEGAFGGVTSENLRKVYLPASLKPDPEEGIDAYLASLFPGQDFTASDVMWYDDAGDLNYVTVTYDMNFEGGETTSEQVLDYLDALPVPSRDRYAFAGWWTSSDDSGEPVDMFRSFDSDTTLYAHWVETPVTFGGDAPWTAVLDNVRGEWVLQSGDVAFGYTSSASMAVMGPCIVTFLYKNVKNGWEGANELKLIVDGEEVASYGAGDNWTVVDYEQVEAGEHTVTWLYENKNGSFSDYAQLADFAVEEATPRTVTFNLVGGTMSEAGTRTVLRNVGTLPRPRKDNSIFGGWWTAADGGDRVNSGDTIEGDISLYAHWIDAPFSAGGDKDWFIDEDGSFKSESLVFGEQIYAEVRYTGPCRVSFDWKAATSYYSNNNFEFFVDGVRKAAIQGESNGNVYWRSDVSFDVEGDGEHVLRWVFEYDDEWGNYGNPENCVWLKNVVVGPVCSVVLDPNYGDAVPYETLQSGTVGNLPLPERDDYYRFDGWYSEASGGERISDDTPLANGATYYAHWADSPFRFSDGTYWLLQEDGSWRSPSIESYTSSYAIREVEGPCVVSFKWKFVSSGDSNQISFSDNYDTVRYVNTDADWSEVSYTIEGSGTHVLRLEYYGGYYTAPYAYAEVKDFVVEDLPSYTLTFDLNYPGGENITRKVLMDGAVVGNPPSVLRSGYAVNGWWTAATGGERISAATTVSADITYYAHWVECPFTPESTARPWEMGPDGEWRTARMASYGDYGAVMTVEGPCLVTFDWKKVVSSGNKLMRLEVDGSFDSWCDSGDWETKSVTIAEAGSHTVMWDSYVNNLGTTVDDCFMVRNIQVVELVPCVVTFDPNYQGAPDAATRNVMTGDPIGELPSARRSGYALVGWFTAAEGGTQITAETVVSATMTVYAHWIEATSFDSTGGDANWSVEADGSWKSGTITHSQNTWAEVMVAGPCRVSFKWKTSSESGYDKLHLYVDGSTEDYVSPISGTGADWAEVVFALADSGSHTVRWTYSKDGSQSTGSDCGWVKDLVVTELVTHTVTFNPNYSGGANTTRSVASGDPIGELPSATRSGYALVGWFTDPTAGTQVTAETLVVADITVYARWEEIVYCTVTFDLNYSGAPDATTRDVQQNTVIGELPSATRDGYRFVDWFSEPTGGFALTAEEVVAADMTVYAHWEKRGPEVTYELRDSYGDGWNGCAIKMFNDATDELLATMTIEGGSEVAGTIPVVAGVQLRFEWVEGRYADETSFEIRGVNDEVIVFGSGAGFSDPVRYVVPGGTPEPPPVSIDDTKMEEPVLNEETGVRTIAAKDGETLTQSDVESVTIASPSDPTVDITAAYKRELDSANNQIVVTLAEPETTAVAAENKDAEDATGILEDVSKVGEGKIAEAPTPDTSDPDPSKHEEVGALPVKMYKGLWYQASWGDDLKNLTPGTKFQADGTKTHIGVIKQKGSSGFYRIDVGEK